MHYIALDNMNTPSGLPKANSYDMSYKPVLPFIAIILGDEKRAEQSLIDINAHYRFLTILLRLLFSTFEFHDLIVIATVL